MLLLPHILHVPACPTGKVLVRYYGDHSNSWVAHKQLVQWDDADVASKNTALTQWGKKNSR